MKYFYSWMSAMYIFSSSSQVMPLTLEPDGGNRKASVSDRWAIVKIAINYNRPRVKRQDGKIWNTSVAHYGFVDLGHGHQSCSAMEEQGRTRTQRCLFSHPVKIEGRDLPAGHTDFFIALGRQ
jgi:hypothetical protein